MLKFVKKIDIAGGGGFLENPHGFLGGEVKKPCRSTMGGGGVKNGRKSVHMVYGCRHTIFDICIWCGLKKIFAGS